MVCADTDFIIDLGRANQKAFEKLKEIGARGEKVFTIVITVAELYHGAHLARDRVQALDQIRNDLSKFSVLNLDYESAALWGELVVEQTKSNFIGEGDLLIACIALSNKQTLLTKNVKHFQRTTGLKIESW
jgi:tRNA(fMet)-specific endonuclease VapC